MSDKRETPQAPHIKFLERAKETVNRKIGRASKKPLRQTMVVLPESQMRGLLDRAKGLLAETIDNATGITAEEIRLNAARRHAGYLGIETEGKDFDHLDTEIKDKIKERGGKESELLGKDMRKARQQAAEMGIEVDKIEEDDKVLAAIRERRSQEEERTGERMRQLEADDLTWYMAGVNVLVEDAQRDETVTDVMAMFDQNIGLMDTSAIKGQARDIDPHSQASKMRAEALTVFCGLNELNQELTKKTEAVEKALDGETDKTSKRAKHLQERLNTLKIIEEQVAPLVYFQEVTQRRITEKALEIKEKGANGQVLRIEEVFLNKKMGEGANLLDFKVGVYKIGADGRLEQEEHDLRDINAWNLGRRGTTRRIGDDNLSIMEHITSRPINLWKLLGGPVSSADLPSDVETGLRVLFGRSDHQVDEFEATELSEGVRNLAKRVNGMVRGYSLKEQITLDDIESGVDNGAKIVLQSMAQKAINDYFTAYLGYVEQKENGFPRGYIESSMKELARATNAQDVTAIRVASERVKRDLERSLEDFDRQHSVRKNESLASVAAASKFAMEEDIRRGERKKIAKRGERQEEQTLGLERVIGEQLNIEAVYEARLALFKAKEIFDSASVQEMAEILENHEFSNMIMRHIGVVLHEVPGVAELLQLGEIRAQYQKYAWLTGINELKDGKVVTTKVGVIDEVKKVVDSIQKAVRTVEDKQGLLRSMIDRAMKDPRYRDFQDQEKQLAAIEVALKLLAKGTSDALGGELERVMSKPSQEQMVIVNDIRANEEALAGLMGVRKKDTVKISALLREKKGLQQLLLNVEDDSRFTVGTEGWIDNMTVPDQTALLAKIDTATMRLSRGEITRLRKLYGALTGKDPNAASYKEITEALMKSRVDILNQRAARAKSDQFLGDISALQAEIRKIKTEMAQENPYGELGIATQELYAVEYLGDLLKEQKRIENKIGSSAKEQTIEVQVIENGKFITKQVKVPAGKSYYDVQREEIENRLLEMGLDPREMEAVEDLASTIRVITGLDAAGNKVHPFFEGEETNVPYEAIDTLAQDATTGAYYIKRTYHESGKVTQEASPNRVARLVFNYRNNLLLATAQPTHYKMVINTRYSDLGLRDWWHDKATPGMPAFWRGMGVSDIDMLPSIDMAAFSMTEVPYANFKAGNNNASYKEWIRYINNADKARKAINKLLMEKEITLDSVNKLEILSLLDWKRRVEAQDVDERLDWECFFQELATDHEVNSPDNRAGWKKIRVHNDAVYQYYTDRVKKGALAGRYRYIYMLPIGAQIPLSALGSEAAGGAEKLTTEQRARMVLHLGYAIDGKNLIENTPGFKKSRKFDKLKKRFGKFGSLNGVLLQDFLDRRYFLKWEGLSKIDGRIGRFKRKQTVAIRKFDKATGRIVGMDFAQYADLAKNEEGLAAISAAKSAGEFFEADTRITILDLMVLGGQKAVSEDKEPAFKKNGSEIVWRGKLEYDEHAGTLESPIYKMFMEKLAKERSVDFKKYVEGDEYTVSVLNSFAQEHLEWRKWMLEKSNEDWYPFSFDSYTSIHTFLNMLVCDSSWVNLFNTTAKDLYRDFRALGSIWENLEFGITATLSKDKTKKRDTHLNHIKIVSNKGDILASILHGAGYQEVHEFSSMEMEITRTPRGSIGWIPFRLEFLGLEELMYRTWEWQRYARNDTESPTETVLGPDQVRDVVQHGFKSMWVVGEWNEFFKKNLVRWGIWKGDWAARMFTAYRVVCDVVRQDNETGFIKKLDEIKLGKFIPFGLGSIVDTLLPINPARLSTWLYYAGVAGLTLAAITPKSPFSWGILLDSAIRMLIARQSFGFLPRVLTHKGMKDLTTINRNINTDRRKTLVGGTVLAALASPVALAFGLPTLAGLAVPAVAGGLTMLITKEGSDRVNRGIRFAGAAAGIVVPLALTANPAFMLLGAATSIGMLIAHNNIQQKLFIASSMEKLENVFKPMGDRLTAQFGSKLG